MNSSTSPEDVGRQPFLLIDEVLDFGDFYRTRRDSIGRALALTFGDESLGFEAVDEAMVRACRRWDEVGTAANPAGWVYRTGLNWGRSWLRRRVLASLKVPELKTLRQQNGRAANRPLESLIDDQALADALDRLSRDHRAVIVLRFYQDWTIDDIAQALEVPAGTVKSRLNRALAALETSLGKEYRYA